MRNIKINWNGKEGKSDRGLRKNMYLISNDQTLEEAYENKDRPEKMVPENYPQEKYQIL